MAHTLYELIVHVWESKTNESFDHLYAHAESHFQVTFSLFLNKKVPDSMRKWKTGSPVFVLHLILCFPVCKVAVSIVLPILWVTSPSTTKEMERWPNEI